MIMKEGDRIYIDVIKHDNFIAEVNVKERQVQIEADVRDGDQLQLWRVFSVVGGEIKANNTGVVIDRSTPAATMTDSGRYFIRCCNAGGHSTFTYREIAKGING